MFEVSVEREFCAAHALQIAGVIEPIHGHNFRVTLSVASDSLDQDALVVDFHALESALDAVLAPWVNNNLNALEPFNAINPSAENIAREIAHRVLAALPPNTNGARVSSCRVTEAPGCAVTYRLPWSAQASPAKVTRPPDR